MRLAFLGTPEAAVPSLRALLNAGHEVGLVITRPDRRRRRHGPLEASPVKAAALELGLSVAHRLGALEGLGLERGVVVAYGALIPAAMLEWLPMLNVHFSLLPRWRGAAPVQRAILAGDAVTGVSIISLEATLDTGPIHLARELAVGEKTADELLGELAVVGATTLLEVLASPTLLNRPVAQAGVVTYAEKITKESLQLRPAMGAVLAARTVRLGGSWLVARARRLGVEATAPSAYRAASGTLERVGERVVAGTDDGALELVRVRPEGSRSMSAASWWAGLHLEAATLPWS